MIERVLRPFQPPSTQRDQNKQSQRSLPHTNRFVLIPFADISFAGSTRWLVKGLLASTGLAVIFGAPKQYKSFVAADLALHIAAGTPWAGRRVLQGAVVYIVGEGQAGFCDRVAANRLRYDYRQDLPFFLIKARPNLGTSSSDSAALIRAIAPAAQGVPLAAIFIDTLARTLAGSSENDEGMRNFIDNAEAIANHFDCVAVAVHHTGKDATKGMRGSSALQGAVVSSWRVEKLKDLRAQVTLQDAKDGESGQSWIIDFERYVYGRDEDGEDKSVLIVREISEPQPERNTRSTSSKSVPPCVRMPSQLKLFMSCLDEVAAARSRPAWPSADGRETRVTPLEAVRLEYYRRRSDEGATPEAKKKAFQLCQKNGLERRLILIQDDVNGEKVVWRRNTCEIS